MGYYAIRQMWERIQQADNPALPEPAPLPDNFPARAKLEAAGLTTLEAVRANLGNLRKLGLTKREAEQVEAAL
ncbi:ribonucleotide-diphosphate reductase subunit beta-like protein [Meiothermus phage MMP17]|nr:prepilin-type N-terminal cleavage/methylation domain-containing protein [Meiothermus phage MMP7]QAY18071.1 ribonucleotide-diphosphate reductase subunit beta-like protein [Meiothermus phage MMP17]